MFQFICFNLNTVVIKNITNLHIFLKLSPLLFYIFFFLWYEALSSFSSSYFIFTSFSLSNIFCLFLFFYNTRNFQKYIFSYFDFLLETLDNYFCINLHIFIPLMWNHSFLSLLIFIYLILLFFCEGFKRFHPFFCIEVIIVIFHPISVLKWIFFSEMIAQYATS